jgi:hypothetical protein
MTPPDPEKVSEAQKARARRIAEQRRLEAAEGKKRDGTQRNAPGQGVHDAEDDPRTHEGDTARDTDELYGKEAENEVTVWRRHSDLDAPPARAGYVHRFIRTRVGMTRDTSRFRQAYREGWRPVKASAVNGHSLPTTRVDGSAEDVIGVEDLVLCEMPEAVFDERQRYYRAKLADQHRAIERQVREVSQESGQGFGPIEQTRRSSVSVRPPDQPRGVADD